MSNKVISYKEAAKLIKDGATVATTTFGLGGLSEQMLVGIEERYAEEQHPKDITFVNSSGIGNNQPGNGLDHLVAEGLVKRLISGHIGSSPLMGQAVINNQVESYLFPQGVITQLYRSIAGKKPGLITKVGLKTYADPRVEGAKGNTKATEDLVELVKLNGEEWLNYKNFPIDVALVRRTYADGKGNISIERETGKLESLPLATAARNSGGIVIAQVTKIVENGTIKPKDVSVAEKHNLTVWAKVVDYKVAGVEAEYMGMGPVPAIKALLERNGLDLQKDVGILEINEAFAAQQVACLDELGVDMNSDWYKNNYNPNGGGVSLGHPLGMSGARIMVSILHEFKNHPEYTNTVSVLLVSVAVWVLRSC